MERKIDKPVYPSMSGIGMVPVKRGWWLLVLLLVAGNLSGQDTTRPAPKLLPFQQDAPPPQTDEQLALSLYQSQEFDKAAEVYQRLYDNKPSLYIYQYLFNCLIEMKDFGRAEKLVRKAQKNEPGSPRYKVDQGYIFYRSGNEEKARKIYDEAIRDLAPSQQQIAELANAFTIRGENENAIKTYTLGRELLNNSYPFGFELASVYERMGDFKSAMNEYLDLLETNPTYLNTVQDRIQMHLSYDINNEKNEAFRKALLGRVQRDPDKTYYAELLWWYSIQQKDFELALIQAKAMDRRLKENGDKLMQLATLSISNGKFDIAVDCYQYLVSKGPSFPNYLPARRELVNTKYLKLISEPAPDRKQMEALEKSFIEEMTADPDAPESVPMIRNLAHLQAFYLRKQVSAIELLTRVIENTAVPPADKAKAKIELADILLFTGDVWEATLLYQQAYQDFKNDVIGQEAKFRNAKLSYYIGEFKWAKAQADVLKAATSKFISNDAIALSLLIGENFDPDSNTVALGIYARADLLDYRNEPDSALKTLDSIPALFAYHPILQHVLMKKAEIYRAQGNFAMADSLFKELIVSYPGDLLSDKALMQRALLNENQPGKTETAMTLYQLLLDTYPGSIYVEEARKRYRSLRGDKS